MLGPWVWREDFPVFMQGAAQLRDRGAVIAMGDDAIEKSASKQRYGEAAEKKPFRQLIEESGHLTPLTLAYGT
jgi:hypothetical protein